MTGLLVVLIPLLLMLFAFSMERIEASLLHPHIATDTEVKLAKNTGSKDNTDTEGQAEATAA
ncbi:hypothetical protein SFC07_04790 [Corynebacterium callunae]|uniref:hypothetical protein n=1 Tax=Corynebacterium callunae TaxID=1721 RepID=UPI00398259B6